MTKLEIIKSIDETTDLVERVEYIKLALNQDTLKLKEVTFTTI